jgi:MEKHLA domain
MFDTTQLPWQQENIIIQTQKILHSYQHWTGQSLFDLSFAPQELAQLLFEAPFVVISHGTEADPILNYGNQTALELWELPWEEFIIMPSRKTAPELIQLEINNLLAEAQAKGFINNYSGVRISSTGKRFFIENSILWNLLDDNNQKCGQAALFFKWKYV